MSSSIKNASNDWAKEHEKFAVYSGLAIIGDIG